MKKMSDTIVTVRFKPREGYGKQLLVSLFGARELEDGVIETEILKGVADELAKTGYVTIVREWTDG
jgi:hypothetical protein